MEEDEGFSDWTQRLERRRQQAQRMEELSQATEEQDQRPLNGAAKPPTPYTLSVSATPTSSTPTTSTPTPSTSRLQRWHKAEAEDEKEKRWERKESERKGREQEEEVVREERERDKEAEKQRQEQMRVLKKRQEDQRPDAEKEVKEKRKEVKVSYTSKVVLHTETKPGNANGDAAGEKVTSYIAKTKLRAPRAVVQVAAAEAEEEAILETEAKLEKIRRSHAEKENQELEQLRYKQVEAEQELEALKSRREERRQVRKEEERRSREEEQQRLAKEERRRMEAAERMKSLSTSSVDGDEMFSPLSPKGSIYKITERTESLNRSLKKSNSFKKTQPPVLLTKIDDRLEQYTTAIEYSQEVKAAKQGLMDIPMSPEAVSSKKNLFEAGEAWNQCPTKGTPTKARKHPYNDAESLKVGVADMITQWYKFVMTAHGKYEKIPVDDENMDGYTNGKAGEMTGSRQ
ncbi:unnamed protein product, partial [Coregonus sp. 'balchen']